VIALTTISAAPYIELTESRTRTVAGSGAGAGAAFSLNRGKVVLHIDGH